LKKIRIAAGAGYAGDRIEPAIDIIKRGNVDYLIFECLAERTIAMAQQEKRANPNKGYNSLLEYRFEKIAPLLKTCPVKIITNMGAANPLAAAEKISEIALAHRMHNIKVAAIIGDDVLSQITAYYDLSMLETKGNLGSISDKIISANAYIGGECISSALAQGADIVVTGRVADPCLVSGPLMYEFGKSYDNFDFVGKCILAGHLLECAGQVTGGYFADPGIKDVPELWDLGFPILTFDENGAMLLEKLPETGGIVSAMTVKEQLLYEIQDPKKYITPDVVADFSNVMLTDLGNDKVLITGACGTFPTGSYKVSVGYMDGWIGEGEISYGGHNALARAKLAGQIIRKRLEVLDFPTRELRIEIMGANSLYKEALPTAEEPVEVRLRVSARTDTSQLARVIGSEVEALYTNGPAGGGGARGYIHEVVAIASILIPRDSVKPYIKWVS